MLRWLRRLLRGAPQDSLVRLETWSFQPALDRSTGSHPVEVAIHPLAKSGRIVVMLPGWDGAIDGYQDKYAKIADLVRSRGVGAVVRCGNHPVPGHEFETTCRTLLRGLVEEAVRRAPSICGASDPEVYLLGFSAGASAVAAMASSLAVRVQKMLLIAPSSDAGYDAVAAGLRAYTGDLYVTFGERDLVVRDLPSELFQLATEAKNRALVVIPDCDHQFRGVRNGRILSQAPLWAFVGDTPFPDPDRGIHLYD